MENTKWKSYEYLITPVIEITEFLNTYQSKYHVCNTHGNNSDDDGKDEIMCNFVLWVCGCQGVS